VLAEGIGLSGRAGAPYAGIPYTIVGVRFDISATLSVSIVHGVFTYVEEQYLIQIPGIILELAADAVVGVECCCC
jgi:hypothetical protein